jgi:hypothetical protein
LLLSRLDAFSGLAPGLEQADDNRLRRQVWPRLIPPLSFDEADLERWSYDLARWLGSSDYAIGPWEPDRP